MRFHFTHLFYSLFQHLFQESGDHRLRRRSLQIASNIQRELQQRLARGLNDPRVRGLVTVTKVELSDDLKHAKAYISVMPEDRASLTMHGLTAATKRLRRDVMDRIHLKEMPTLRLVYDRGHQAETEVFTLLEQDRREQESKNTSGWSSHGKIEDGSQDDSGLESSEDPIA